MTSKRWSINFNISSTIDRRNVLDPIENRDNHPISSVKNPLQQQLNLSPTHVINQGKKRSSGTSTRYLENRVNSQDTHRTSKSLPRKKLKYDVRKFSNAGDVSIQSQSMDTSTKQTTIESYFK